MESQSITKATNIFTREDGSQARVTAEQMMGAGLHTSIDIRVHRRATKNHDWVLCNDRPHPNWRSMSVQSYLKHGRSEVMQTVSHGEILKTASLIGQPIESIQAVSA